MRSELLADADGTRRFILVLESGEEACGVITGFAQRNDIQGATLTAIGGVANATVGWFDLEQKKYQPIEIAEQCEVLSVVGDIVAGEHGKPVLHAHLVLGRRDGSACGGHLVRAEVRPTLEVILVETPARLRRRKRPDIGAALIDLDR